MSYYYSYKSCELEVKDIDEKGRIVTVYASAFGNKDADGDIILSGAFKKSVSERGPKGDKSIRHLLQHDRNKIVGKPIEIEEDGYGLLCKSYILNTTMGNDVLEMYKNDVFQHSIGFQTIKGDTDPTRDAYMIREVKLYEFSSVTWGANPLTPTVGIKSPFSDFEGLQDRKERLESAIKKGNFSDEAFKALEAELKEVQKFYTDLLSLKKPEPITHSGANEPKAAEIISIINQKFKLN